MPSAPEVFDAHAGDYDALRRRLVPVFDDFYGAAIAALSLAGRPPRRVLDVGAGTGLLSELVHRAMPQAALTLLDGSAAMLAAANARLGPKATYVRQDFAEQLPAGPWDAIVAALAIHHLPDRAKRALYAQIPDHLAALDPQLAWLREAGFVDVDCLFKQHGFAVIVGRHAERSA
jgi:tRNA (cmo5U34)-methyltransferase